MSSVCKSLWMSVPFSIISLSDDLSNVMKQICPLFLVQFIVESSFETGFHYILGWPRAQNVVM